MRFSVIDVDKMIVLFFIINSKNINISEEVHTKFKRNTEKCFLFAIIDQIKKCMDRFRINSSMFILYSWQ